jgi:hypothetical protein
VVYILQNFLAVLGYIIMKAVIIANVTLKQIFTEALIPATLCSYSITTLFHSLTISGGKVQEILRIFSEIDQFSLPSCIKV